MQCGVIRHILDGFQDAVSVAPSNSLLKGDLKQPKSEDGILGAHLKMRWEQRVDDDI